MTVRRFIDSLPSYVPTWLSNRPTYQTGFKFLWTAALLCDIAMEVGLQGLRAAWPGADARADNTAQLAFQRGLVMGETETVADFQARLINWLTTWQSAGSDIAVVTQLHEYIAGNPQVRMITRSGRFTTISAAGVVTQVQGSWNWDSVSNPERALMWRDAWIIVYPIAPGYYVENVGAWGNTGSPGYTPSSDLGWGHSCTRVEVNSILAIVRKWKASDTNLKCIVWCNGTDVYAPTPVAGSPDGTWGKAFVQATNLMSRNTVDDFWGTGTDTNSW